MINKRSVLIIHSSTDSYELRVDVLQKPTSELKVPFIFYDGRCSAEQQKYVSKDERRSPELFLPIKTYGTNVNQVKSASLAFHKLVDF